MLQPLAIVSVFASAALAQSFAGVSSSCNTFLKALNADPSLTACSSSMANATAAYGAAKDNSKPITQDTITSTLDSICKSGFSCSDTTIRSKLAEFYANCTEELTSKQNEDVIAIYDAMYAYVPFKKAICSKDDSGSYCVLKTSTVVQSQPSLLTDVQKYLWAGDSKYSAPNMTTFGKYNIPFLFLSPSLSYNALCTSCTRNIMTTFMSWQSDSLYASGVGSSPSLGGETDLYKGIQKTCGAQFLSTSLQAAGGLGQGSSNGSLKTFGLDLITVFIGVVTMAFTTTL